VCDEHLEEDLAIYHPKKYRKKYSFTKEIIKMSLNSPKTPS
jgi:hypothetical protein